MSDFGLAVEEGYDVVYEEGKAGFYQGEKFTNNPYIDDPALYHWYGEGWLDAREEQKKESGCVSD